jgi:hypothetical protein
MTEKRTLISLGSDPEVFAINPNGEVTTSLAAGIQGDKQNVFDIGDGYSIHKDNILVELNVPISNTKEEFIATMLEGWKKLLKAMAPFSYRIASSLEIDEDILAGDPNASEFGCDPDICAWTGKSKRPSDNSASDTLRTAGGHIHIGFSGESDLDFNIRLVKILDILLGIPSVVLDEDNRRRGIYGQAGSFRHKPYGLEYRSLSNFWVNSPQLIDWIWNSVETALDIAQSDFVIDESSDAQLIQDCINDSDIELVKHFDKIYKLEIHEIRELIRNRNKVEA